MSGSLLDIARLEAKQYITSGGFEEDITIKTPDGNTEQLVKGLASKHHINFDTDGTLINTKNAHICLSESDLSDLNYPVRVNNEISLINHLVSLKDSSGIEKNYIIRENFPDETLGLIICILGDYDGN